MATVEENTLITQQAMQTAVAAASTLSAAVLAVQDNATEVSTNVAAMNAAIAAQLDRHVFVASQAAYDALVTDPNTIYYIAAA